MNEEIKRFSDFSDERGPLDGSKVKLDDILNIEIKLTAFEIRQSKFKRDNQDRVMTLQFERENKLHIIFTGSEVLIKQMEKYKDHLPFLTKINRIGKYYTLS